MVLFYREEDEKSFMRFQSLGVKNPLRTDRCGMGKFTTTMALSCISWPVSWGYWLRFSYTVLLVWIVFWNTIQTLTEISKIFSDDSHCRATIINKMCCHQVDVYSFGVLLCEMCVRELPNPQQRQTQTSRMEPRRFQEIVERCLQTEPGERPNMKEIIDDLTSSLESS